MLVIWGDGVFYWNNLYNTNKIHEEAEGNSMIGGKSMSGQIIATSAEVTPNGGLVRESPQNALNSGLGTVVICPAIWMYQHEGGYRGGGHLW